MKKIILLAVTFIFCASASTQIIFLETEKFEDKGGWVIDPLFIDQMGSPFLLAHGIGKPVNDAKTVIEINEPGDYSVWVRTRNWNADWDESQAPGRYQILFNGKPLPNEFGIAPSKWGWINGGSIYLDQEDVEIRLHDLTGFDGRCDAIILTKDKYFVPSNDNEELTKLRDALLGSQTIDEGDFDLVVVGAGLAGLTTALSAARLGVKTALVHNRPIVGGNNSSEINIVIQGGICLPPYKNIGKVVAEIGNVYDKHDYVISAIKNEPNLKLFLNMHGNGVEMDGTQIKSVLATNILTADRHKFKCKYVADCTGDGAIGFLAGAEYRIGREPRREFGEVLAPEEPSSLSYGSTVKWNATKTKKQEEFPVTPWALQFSEVTVQYATSYDWDWETGFRYNQIEDFEYIRDYFLRVIYGNWSYIKNFSKRKEDYKDYDLTYVSFVPGKRESRRLIGDVIFTQQDIEGEYVKYDDAFVKGTYSIDQHFPHPENTVQFPGEEFRSIQKHCYNPLGPTEPKIPGVNINNPYLIPYRCLYSKNINNLFMAGRDISVSHIALTSTRLQGATGMMGEIVGMASSVCVKNECSPREVYTLHLSKLKKLVQQGIVIPNVPENVKFVPEWH